MTDREEEHDPFWGYIILGSLALALVLFYHIGRVA